MLSNNKKVVLALVALATVSTGACASAPGNLNGLSSDPMATLVVYRNPDHGDLDANQYETVVRQSRFCANTADRQLSGAGETIVTQGVLSAVGSAAGVALGASAGLGASASSYGIYGAAAGAGSGIMGGATIYSNARTTVITDCVRQNLSDPATRRNMAGVHVSPAYVRSRNTSRTPVGLRRASAVAPQGMEGPPEVASGEFDQPIPTPLPR